MACKNSCQNSVESFQLPKISVADAMALVDTLCDLINAGIKTLPDALTTTEILAILNTLIRKNIDLRTELEKRQTPRAISTADGIQFFFGPTGQYVLDVPVARCHCAAFAAQLELVVNQLKKRAAENDAENIARQTVFPFADCA